MWVALQKGQTFFKNLVRRWGGYFRINLIFIVKVLPSQVGGFLLWAWVYGVSWRSWFPYQKNIKLQLSQVEPHKLLDRALNPTLRGGPSRLRPQVSNLTLFDREWYSLDTVFPVRGDEPFQELGWDYFIQQQESDPTGDEEFIHEEDLNYETIPPPSGDEDDPHLWEVDRFRWLERRELSYRREDLSGGESVEFFEAPDRLRRSETTLDRLVDPGDGPIDHNPDENPLVYDGYYARWFTSADWYFFRVNPTRITTGFTWPEGYYYYLLYEHRHTWGGDPTGGDTTRWARSTRGMTPWLFRRKTRRWDAARWGLFQVWKKRISRLWSKPPPRPYNPAGHTRRGTPSLRRHWWRQYRRLVNPKNNRWGAPFSGRTANFLTDTDEWGYFENTRFLTNSQPHRHRQLQAFRSRLRMGQTRRSRTQFFRPSWWYHSGLNSKLARAGWWIPTRRPARKRILPWVAPRWAPSVGVRSREVPATGGFSLFILLVGWFLFYVLLESIPVMINFVLNPLPWFDLSASTPTTRMWWWPADFFSWGKLTTTGSFEGDYLRKATLGIPPEWELYRGGSPRERFSVRTWGFGAYRPHRENWRWQYLDPVGLHWWSHPGQGANLLQLTYRRSAWEPILLGQSVTVGTDWLTQWFFGFNGRDINNNMGMRLFFPYMDWFIPSWAHAHGVIGDEWVVYRSFRTWKDEGQELETVRRMIDHRYNDLFDISKYLWKLMYKRMFPFPAWPSFTAEWTSRIDPIQRPFFTNPEWVPPVTPAEGSLWEMAYLDGWERVSSSHLWPSSRANKRWRILLTTFDAEFSLDSRARSRSEGFPYMGVPTRWEPHLNRELLNQWSQSNPMENFPHSYFAWWDSRVALVTEIIPPLWSKLVYQLIYPALRWSFYVGGFILLWSSRVWSPPRGVRTLPVQRFTPGWGGYSGGIGSNVKSIPNSLGKVVLYRGDRYLRRWGKPNLFKGNPERALLEEPHWKWTPEAYWSSHRGGFSRRVPRVGARSRVTPRGGLLPPRGLPGLKPDTSFWGNPVTPGGGLGYLATRFAPWRSHSTGNLAELFSSRGGPKFWTPRGTGPSGWLFRPVGANRLESWGESYLNRSYPTRGRRRPRRWFERFLHPEGVKARYRRRRRPRGWHARVTPRRENEGAGAGALLPTSKSQLHWRVPPEWFHRKGQSEWLRYRYRNTVGGGSLYFSIWGNSLSVRTAGVHLARVNYPERTTLFEESTPMPGYLVEWYRDEYFADLDGHQPDDDLENEFDSGLESYNGFRYLGGGLTPPMLRLSSSQNWPSKLVSYHRGCILPGSFYSQISPGGWNSTWGGPVWGPLGVDHPAGELPLLEGYEIPRLGRRISRVAQLDRTVRLDEGLIRRRRGPRRRRTGYFEGGDSLWASSGAHLRDELNLLGWTTQEGSFNEFILDDLDGVSFGSSALHGGGYRWAGLGALRGTQNRPLGVNSVWTPSSGLNGWRYLVGESVGFPNPTDSERILLDRLTTGYNDGYDLETLEYNEDLLFDRDPEDPDEDEDGDENEEVPRARAQDFPPWVIDLALGGASPGEISPEGMYTRLGDFNFAVPEDNEDAGFRSSRRELRRYYRRGRVKMSPWRRRNHPLTFSRQANPVNEYLRGVSPGAPEDGELTRRDAQGITGAAYSDFENDEDYTGEVDPSLRLWALTEIYYGDYSTGVYLDS